MSNDKEHSLDLWLLHSASFLDDNSNSLLLLSLPFEKSHGTFQSFVEIYWDNLLLLSLKETFNFWNCQQILSTNVAEIICLNHW